MADLEKIYNNLSKARRFVIWTAALEAMGKSQPKVVMAAIDKIRDLRSARDRQAARKLLRWSVGAGHLDIAEAMLKLGVDPDTKRQLGDGTLLCDTVTANNKAMANLLLKYGASTDKLSHPWGNSPMHLAVTYDHAEMVTVLLEHGADYTLRNKKGQTPLELARSLPVRDARRVLDEYISFGHAAQIKSAYKSTRKGRGRPVHKRRLQTRARALHL